MTETVWLNRKGGPVHRIDLPPVTLQRNNVTNFNDVNTACGKPIADMRPLKAALANLFEIPVCAECWPLLTSASAL